MVQIIIQKLCVHLCLTVMHFVALVVIVLWTPNSPKQNSISVHN